MTYGDRPPVLRAAVDRPLPGDPEGEATGARAYVAHVDGDLGGYPRGYLIRLREGRPARVGEALPGL
ncbi:hypothetical protein [Streptomyces sp. NPDC001568]|uniref:hypothetical protein n=1 Tax=Streptomyces sp. NPDC001568 TaxID=3364588 RepID=UPI00368BBD31